MANIDAGLRREMARLIRANRFTTDFSREVPTNWRPYEVRDPRTNDYFTEASAQEYAALLLDTGHRVEEIVLDRPQGKRGFVMKKQLNPGHGELYIKLQMGHGCVIGRSFHLSE